MRMSEGGAIMRFWYQWWPNTHELEFEIGFLYVYVNIDWFKRPSIIEKRIDEHDEV
jgi:hypothetical protein